MKILPLRGLLRLTCGGCIQWFAMCEGSNDML